MAQRFRAALLAALLFPQASYAQAPETFSASLTVREREILVELPEGIDGGALDPRDFLVLVDGVPREVTRAEPASEWTILLYVDQILARPGTVFYSTLALAHRVRDLARTGTVEVAVADSDPRTLLAATRDEKRIALALTDLSGAARVERDVQDARASGPAKPALEQSRRQLDKLLAFLASRRPTGPHAVFLIADGPDLTPEETALLERQDDPAAPPASVFHRASRLLSAYGWVTVTVPMRKEGVGISIAPQNGLERIRQSAAPSDHQNSVPPIRPGLPPNKTTLAWTGVIDLAVEPRTAALRILSRASGGTVLGFEQQIEPTLSALSRRWRLWVSETDNPVDGRLRTVEVRLPDQMHVGAMFYPIPVKLSGGARKQARPQAWMRSSTPVEIAEARLEDLLAGRGVSGGGLPLTAAASRAELRIELAPIQNTESAPPGPLRVSWAFPRGEGGEGITEGNTEGNTAVHHETFSGEGLGQGLRRTLRIEPPAGARQVAVVVEALGPERWAGTVLEIP